MTATVSRAAAPIKPDIVEVKDNLTVTDQALLLTVSGVSSENTKIARLLAFFGVPWRIVTKEEFVSHSAAHESASKCRVVCSSDAFLRLTQDLEDKPQHAMAW